MRNIFITLFLFMSFSITSLARYEDNECYSVDEVAALLRSGEQLCDAKICIFDLHFDFAKWDLKKESVIVLDDVIEKLRHFEGLSLRVVGHTDDIDTEESNQLLSERRAKAVANYFVLSGIWGDSISSLGKGEGVPISDNLTEEGRAKNRRVEIVVFYNCDDLVQEELLIEEKEQSFFDTILPVGVRDYINVCEGRDTLNFSGRYSVSNRKCVYVTDGLSYLEDELPDQSIFFSSRMSIDFLDYYEKEGMITTLYFDNARYFACDSMFTVFFSDIVENKDGSSGYLAYYVLTGELTEGGIKNFSKMVYIKDSWGYYYNKRGSFLVIKDGDGFSEIYDLGAGEAMKRKARPKRKNKRHCPSCP